MADPAGWRQEGAGDPARPAASSPAPGAGVETWKPGVIASLSRPRKLRPAVETPTTPPRVRTVPFRASVGATLVRFLWWFWAAFLFCAGTLLDAVRRRNTIERRAVRLRETFERLGPTFVKVGQQLSIRADFLPYAYCLQLGKMLDEVTPFPVETAFAIIERVTGQPVSRVFSVFDPEPIGSASLACVYQATLHGGQRVAVKLRRPGVVTKMAADIRALGWLMAFAEFVGVVRPGMTRNITAELKSVFQEELNFRQEARFTDLFKRRARKDKQRQVTAPRVYHEFSDERMIVTEFVTGIFLTEILGAVDRQDDEALAELAQLDIDPREIAKNMHRTFNWEMLESLIFHADPHPANVVVQPGNRLVFIDFGSCGSLTNKARHLWGQLQLHVINENLERLVQVSVSLMEPLPNIDVHQFKKEVEAAYWPWLYAVKAREAEWWERASGQLWMKLLAIAGAHEVPVSLDTVRLFRATFLYDSIIFRLWPRLKQRREYRAYAKGAGKRIRKRLSKGLSERLRRGLLPEDYLGIQEVAEMSREALDRTHRLLDTMDHYFLDTVGKAAYTFSMALRLTRHGIVYFVLSVLGVMAFNLLRGTTVPVTKVAFTVVSHPAFLVLLGVVALIEIRKLLKRLGDVDRLD